MVLYGCQGVRSDVFGSSQVLVYLPCCRPGTRENAEKQKVLRIKQKVLRTVSNKYFA
jgi:hypothetical protein